MRLHSVLCFLLFAAAPLVAQEPAATPAPASAGARKLTVLVKPARPFAFEQSGTWTGYSIDLWKRIAVEAGFSFELQKKETVPEVIEAIQNEQADVGVGALSITGDREAVIDFTHKFYDSGLQILARQQGHSSAFSAFRKVIGDVLTVIGVLLLALLVNAHILWLLERRRNPESFPESYVAGVWEAVWWSVCTLITGGCENKAPVGVWGRLFAIVWMLAGIGLVAFVTARMASVMTYDTLTSDIRSLADLRGQTVGTIGGSAAELYLREQQMSVRGFGDIDSAGRALEAGEVKALVYDQPILRYYITEHPSAKLELVGDVFEDQSYGFALQQGSPLREEINRIIPRLTAQGYFRELDQRWFAGAKK